jgi:hypothetical protein
VSGQPQPSITTGQTPSTSVQAPLNTFHIPDRDWFMIHDWIDALPMPSRLFQPLGFLAWGVAAQAGFEWHQATSHSDVTWYRLLTIAAVVVGAAFIICDVKLRHEQSKSAAFISERMDHLNAGLGVTRPVRSARRRIWHRLLGWL